MGALVGACAAPRGGWMTIEITVNEQAHRVEAAPDTPLLYVLMNELDLRGPRFGCGLAQCGSCSVLVDGVETRSGGPSRAASVHRRAVDPVRVLLQRHDDQGGRASRAQPAADRRRDSHGDE